MADPNLKDFYRRVSRIEKARAKGFGMEAAGTLGMSYYARPKKSSRSVLVPFLLAMACGFVLKGAIHYNVGAELYQDRVANLMQGEGFDRLGGWLMQPDPVTLFVASQIAEIKMAATT